MFAEVFSNEHDEWNINILMNQLNQNGPFHSNEKPGTYICLWKNLFMEFLDLSDSNIEW